MSYIENCVSLYDILTIHNSTNLVNSTTDSQGFQGLRDHRELFRVATGTRPLAQRRDINPSAIRGYPWIVLKSDHVGNEGIGSFFSVRGHSPPNFALETTSIHSLLQGLRDGNSVAHIPEQMLPLAESVGLERLHLNETIWETTAGDALRKSARLTLAVRKFIEVLATQLPADSD